MASLPPVFVDDMSPPRKRPNKKKNKKTGDAATAGVAKVEKEGATEAHLRQAEEAYQRQVREFQLQLLEFHRANLKRNGGGGAVVGGVGQQQFRLQPVQEAGRVKQPAKAMNPSKQQRKHQQQHAESKFDQLELQVSDALVVYPVNAANWSICVLCVGRHIYVVFHACMSVGQLKAQLIKEAKKKKKKMKKVCVSGAISVAAINTSFTTVVNQYPIFNCIVWTSLYSNLPSLLPFAWRHCIFIRTVYSLYLGARDRAIKGCKALERLDCSGGHKSSRGTRRCK